MCQDENQDITLVRQEACVKLGIPGSLNTGLGFGLEGKPGQGWTPLPSVSLPAQRHLLLSQEASLNPEHGQSHRLHAL